MPRINECQEDLKVIQKNRRIMAREQGPRWLFTYELLERVRDDPDYVANEYVKHAIAER